MNEKKPKIVLLSESRQTEEINDNEIKISNYECVRCDSDNRRTGGCLMYLMNDIKYKIIKNAVVDKTWILCIKIHDGFMNGLYCVIYKSPKQNNKKFIKIIDECFEEMVKESSFNLITGDFNINLLKKSKFSDNIIRLFEEFNLTQYVNESTRDNIRSSSIIDYVLSNKKVHYKIDEKQQITDHSVIEINTEIKFNTEKNKKIKIKVFKYNEKVLQESLNSINFKMLKGKSLNEKAEFIDANLKIIMNKMHKEKNVNENHQQNDWYDGECENLRLDKNNKKYEYKHNKNNITWNSYTSARNRYKSILKKKECENVRQKIVKHSKNSKKLWQIFKEMYKAKPKTIKMIKFNDEEEYNKKVIVNKLNNFYIDSIEKIVADIPQSNSNFYENVPRNDNEFKFKEINKQKVIEILNKLEHKSDCDKISGKTLIHAMHNEEFAEFFVGLINESLLKSVMPDVWKVSTIEPIEKVKNASKPEDLRPINKLPLIEKVIENVVKDQLETFLNENNIIAEEQSGYRKLHSCESAINYVLYRWSVDLETGKQIIVVSLDFKRAFETINIDILLNLLERLGIRNAELKWFRDYMTNRRQKVKIDDEVSDERFVRNGVAQGSALGNVLYLLAVNMLPNIFKNCKVKMYADDTLLTVAADTIEEAEKLMNDDLKILNEWLKFSKLSLNVTKTKFMIISQKKKLDFDKVKIKIDNIDIAIATEIKYLGVVIDNKLSFLNHLDYVKKKLIKKLALFRRINDKLNAYTKIILYKSIVAPHFDYCPSILFCLSDSRIKELQKIQNKYLRNILMVNRATSHKIMLDALCFQSVQQRLTSNVLKMLFKIENGLMPNYLKEILKKNKERIKYNTRRRSLYEVPNFTKNYTQKSIFFKALKLYNECKQIFDKSCFSSLNQFCKKVKMYVKEM